MKSRILFLVVFVLSSVCGIGQVVVDSSYANPRKTIVCGYPWVAPEFIGEDGIYGYLKAHIKYPAEEKKNGIHGTVYISFVVEADGSITDVKERKGVTGGPGLTEESIRVISEMPKWKPGTEYGKPVRTEWTQPVRFVLTDERATDSLTQKNAPCDTQIPEDSLGTILMFTEKMPEYAGGWQLYLIKRIKTDQKSECAGGKVVVTFIVTENGDLVNIQIKDGMENCPLLRQSIINTLCEMPNWEPGMHNGKPVKVRMTMPIIFEGQ